MRSVAEAQSTPSMMGKSTFWAPMSWRKMTIAAFLRVRFSLWRASATLRIPENTVSYGWSGKVANGKSGRALNYIISQQARVDNRISNEEITNYDSDSQMLDYTSSRNCPDSPSSRQSSPQSTAGDSGPRTGLSQVRWPSITL